MPNPRLRLELSKLRVLEFLELHQEDGLTGYRLNSYASTRELPEFPRVPGIKGLYGDVEKCLPDLIDAGLIEQREVMTHKIIKPYFITEAGKTYLAAAKQKAMSTEPSHGQHWAASLNQPDAQQVVAEFLRQQPEFQNNEARIQEVSQQLAAILGKGKTPNQPG